MPLVSAASQRDFLSERILADDAFAALYAVRFPVPVANKVCLICGAQFDPRYNSTLACTVEHDTENSDGYERGGCPGCRDWDGSCYCTKCSQCGENFCTQSSGKNTSVLCIVPLGVF